MWRLPISFIVGLLLISPTISAEYKAGVAVKVITPTELVWMSGYAARTKPAEGTLHDLHVKALALEDSEGTRLVLVTSDLCGIPRDFSVRVANEIRKQTGLPRECLMLTVSHTHCGPVVFGNLTDMYDMPPGEMEKVKRYTAQLEKRFVEVVVKSLKSLKPATLSVGQGQATFAVNRRENVERELPPKQELKGPVDHSVPVLKVSDAKTGDLMAVTFGYACHNTTLSFYQWCGDYAGFAQLELEKRHPGCVALFWSGCGADANPLPRRMLEHCISYGTQLADAIDTVLKAKTQPINGGLGAQYKELSLPYSSVPDTEMWKAELKSNQFAVRQRAQKYLKLIEGGESVPSEYSHYPIQVWRLGDTVLWVSLGGEVVVDYALRLKRELKASTIWVTGYANDVMAYIGSARVIREGGYEGDRSMIYYGLPSKWDVSVEKLIVDAVTELVSAGAMP